jgi:uncharacterized protein (TIGR00299 family) protein
MRIAYLDGFSGISGDMFLGALVDAGVPFELLQKTVAALDIGATLEMSRVERNGISAVKVDVVVAGRKDLPREEFWESSHADEANASHSHDRDEERSSSGAKARGLGRLNGTAEAVPLQRHAHEQNLKETTAEAVPLQSQTSHGRHLSEILKIIAAAPISDGAKKTASAIFRALGEAEAKVHNTDVEKVHFHEVGAADAIVDIVCAAVGAEALGVDRFVASPLNVGSGTVKCAHGVMPVPAPATLELLKGVPVYSGEIQKELVTPTGAAIVRTLAAEFGTIPAVRTEKIGYGAGTRQFPNHSNVLRLVVGDVAQDDAGTNEEIAVLEANLDDLNPQIIGYTTERLLAEGALDVFTTAVQMKKGRPGTLVTVLCKPPDETKLRDILFHESSTLGVRSRREQRRVLGRRHESVATPWGEVGIKIGSVNGTEFQAAPEYEDCRSIAAANNLPLKTVMQEAMRLYLDKKNG